MAKGNLRRYTFRKVGFFFSFFGFGRLLSFTSLWPMLDSWRFSTTIVLQSSNHSNKFINKANETAPIFHFNDSTFLIDSKPLFDTPSFFFNESGAPNELHRFIYSHFNLVESFQLSSKIIQSFRLIIV